MRFLLALALLIAVAGCEDTSQWGMPLHQKLALRSDPVTAEDREEECDWIRREIELERSAMRAFGPQSTAITSDVEIKEAIIEDAKANIATLKARAERFEC